MLTSRYNIHLVNEQTLKTYLNFLLLLLIVNFKILITLPAQIENQLVRLPHRVVIVVSMLYNTLYLPILLLTATTG